MRYATASQTFDPQIEIQQMNIDPNAPAFPATEYFSDGKPNGFFPGLSVRAEIASRIMAGLLANPCGPIQANGINGWSFVNCDPVDVSKLAISLADDLITELNKPQP